MATCHFGKTRKNIYSEYFGLVVGFFLRGPSFYLHSRDSESATLVISGDVVGAIILLVLLHLSDLDIFPLCKSGTILLDKQLFYF